MTTEASTGKRFKFLDGPFKHAIFTVESYDKARCESQIRFALYDKRETVKNSDALMWGWRELS